MSVDLVHHISARVQYGSGSGAALLDQYVRARGLDAPYVLGHLAHKSFVSRRHRYVYVEIPKAACTKLKHFIAEVEDAPFELNRVPYLRETRLTMLIHQRLYLGVPTILDMDAAEVRELLAGKLDYLIFALVRNPYSRLVSAFENKVRQREPGFEEIGRHWGAIEIGADVRAIFGDFVRDAIDPSAPLFRENHFIPQHELLMPELIPYSRFFPVEQFAEFEKTFFAHLRAHGVTKKLEFRDRNRSFYPNWRHYYDTEIATRVAEIYSKDFELFGYDPDSWRLGHPPPSLRTSESDAHRLRAILDRNEMIDFLYGIINQLAKSGR